MNIEERPYGRIEDGRPIASFTVRNANGTTIEVISFGAILSSVKTADRAGHIGEITLGFDGLDGYLGKHPFFGATVGRFANRIAGGRFELEGKRYELARNNGPNHLHGGLVGFDKRVWEAFPFSRGPVAGVRFTYVSPDGEEGYPGTLTAAATYTLAEDDSLELRWEATTDRATPVNLTNHTYWNLSGKGSILDHLVMLHADAYLPVDEGLIPTGEIRPVDSTPFDFRREKVIEQDFEAAGGYDHCFVVSTAGAAAKNAANGKPLRPVAQVFQPNSGRGLRLSGTQPGVQFYTGNTLPGIVGRGGAAFDKYTGFCLETEAFPDAVNRPAFPSAILEPGEKYDEVSKLDFYRN